MAGLLNIIRTVYPASVSAEESTGAVSVDDNTQEAYFLHVLHVSLCLPPLWYLDIWLYFSLPFPNQCHHLLYPLHAGMKMKI